MTLQEIFDTAASHLLSQNCRALDGTIKRACRYRGIHGTKCAFGALFPDEMYDEYMEGLNARTVLEEFPNVRSHIIGTTDFDRANELLGDLQHAHDNFEPHQWRARLTVIGQKFNLYTDLLEAHHG